MKWFTLSVVLFGYVSCATLERFDSPPAGSSVAPTWQSDRILEDFQFLEARSRISQAAFPADVVSYVADRMEGIQPAAGPTRIVNLAAPLHIHHQVSLTAAVDLEAELDYAPFPISDSGKAAVTSLVALPADPNIGNWNKSAAIVTNHEVNVETLRLLSAGGVRAALIVGPLSHNPPAQVTVRGLVALQITDSAALQIAGLSGDEWSTWIAAGTQLDLAEPLHIDVDMQSESWMPGVLGFVPGSDPAFSSQVVIVCAGLAGAFGGRRSVSTGSGLAPALVMELARQYARWSAFELFPKRTVLFAIWPATTYEYAGLRAYLANPIWPVAETHSVYCIGNEDVGPLPFEISAVKVNHISVPATVENIDQAMDSLHHTVMKAADGG